ncbi:MAG: DUF6435 family protein [Fuerstiella sp.]
MFGLFRKNPVKALEQEYTRTLEKARDLQRKGDIVAFAEMSATADEILKKLEAEEAKQQQVAP